jgi:DNA-binding MarR family transcriptional regulator
MNDKALVDAAQELISFMPNFNSKMKRPSEMIIKMNITPIQFGIMFMLEPGNAQSMSDIARIIGVKKQQLTLLIDGLVRHGLVKRGQKENDRRIITISLSDPGKSFLIKQKNILTDNIKQMLSGLDKKQLIALNDSMRIVNKILKEI